MKEEKIRDLLVDVRDGSVTISDAVTMIKQLPYEEVEGYAKLDHHRVIRRGFPEVILAQGKTPVQVTEIFKRLMKKNDKVLATRVTEEVYDQIREQLPQAIYLAVPKILYFSGANDEVKLPGVLVATGGTADIPIAEEAAVTAELMGNEVIRLYDVGVAGIHRLLSQNHVLREANVIVAVAGMEGALASVITGLVSVPVIAVPTSIGYGASFNGLAALLAMLNSCANGMSVVNIDNGFGAGYLAGVINRQAYRESENG